MIAALRDAPKCSPSLTSDLQRAVDAIVAAAPPVTEGVRLDLARLLTTTSRWTGPSKRDEPRPITAVVAQDSSPNHDERTGAL